ncbi:unnamed protein product [Heterobilharzia americana]|nr:unnamed protein product [Heterobilharzia americana]
MDGNNLHQQLMFLLLIFGKVRISLYEFLSVILNLKTLTSELIFGLLKQLGETISLFRTSLFAIELLLSWDNNCRVHGINSN